MSRCWGLFVSIILVMVVIGGYSIWLFQYEEEAVVHILAPRADNAEIPIYAQFIVTQTFQLHEPVIATRFVIPLLVTRSVYPLHVVLRQDGAVLRRWNYSLSLGHGSEKEVRELIFAFDTPTVLKGNFELEFSASEIDHEHRDLAPHVFVETANSAYPDGNYRIAYNEKQGDVGMALYAQHQHWVSLWRLWQRQPAVALSHVTLGMLVLILVSSLPYVLARSAARTMNGTRSQSV